MKEIMHFKSNEERHAFLLGKVKATEFKEFKKKAEPEKKAEPKKKAAKKKEEK